MKKLIIYLFIMLASHEGLLAQTTVGTGGTYLTLSAAFNAINEGDLPGPVTLQIISSITETVAPVLYQTGYNGTSDYTSVTIYPTGSYTIDGDIDGPLIDLNGASNVTIDGRVGGTTPDTKDLTITNISTGTSASTIRFSESAADNTIKYCIIKGSETGATSGVIFFSTATTGTGNDGNTIDNNDITSDAAGRPINAVYSGGTSGSENSGNIISNNNIYNFLKHGTASNGIFLSSNTTSWTISGNSFYETASFVPTQPVTYNVIKIDNTSGTGFTISGNFIGGQAATCGGSAWTKTSASNNLFYAIYLNVGNGTVSSIQNNTIKNFTWNNSSSSAWTGMHIAGGAVNIGTGTANTIGASTGTGSVTVRGGATGTNVYGINIASGGTIDCRNNIIGSITAANTVNASNFFGINKTSAAGTTTISNNTIGSTITAGSINASSASTGAAQSVFGISNAGTGNVTIDGNTIDNLTNSTTNSNIGTAGVINGIRSTDGTNTISDNIIRDLSIANANNSATNTASVCGIALIGSTIKTITGNTIHNLKNTYSSFAGSVIGLYFTGNTGANLVSENFIHSLQVTGVSSASGSIYGIQAGSGAATYSNNIISLGGSTATIIYGINETGVASNDNSLYFNTVYIGGSATLNNSYALKSSGAANIRNFRNNIFVNTRSGGSNLHYAAYIAVPTSGSITCDYNDYYVSGTGTVLGNYGGDKTGVPIVDGQDANSLAIDPAFVNAGGTSAEDYLPTVSLTAVTGTGITTDYNGATRDVPITMGAFEGGSCTNPTNGGIIATAQSGCIPFDPAPFTSTSPASGYTGTFLQYKWQESTTGSGSGFGDISGSNSSTYNAGSLNVTTWFKRLARVSCIVPDDWTGAAESNVLEVTVNPLPNIGLAVGGTGSVCSGTGTNITVGSSENGVNYQLRNGVTNVGVAVAGNGGTINLPTGNLSATTTFNVLATNAVTACSAQLTQTATVTVNPLPNTGLVLGGTGSICTGTSTNITVASSETGINYQLRNDNANEPVGSPVAGTGGTISLPTGNMTNNIQYNVLATNTITSCSAQLTEKEIVSIDPLSVGGSVSGTSPVTYGSSTGTMTLTGNTGIIQRWEKRFNSGSWTIISSTNATYSETPSSAGTWDYRAVVKSGSCAEANSSEFSMTVNKAALTISADNKSKDYGAVLPSFTVTYTGLVNGDPAPATLPTVTTTASASSPAGTYPITASGAADPNYNISYVAGTLTVDKVPLMITADNKNKDYGAALPTLTVTYSGLVNGDTAPATPPSINTTATISSPAGTYPVTASVAADPNYNISYTAGTLTVDKVSLIITPDNKSKDYGASLPVLTVSYTGLVNGDPAPATLPSISTTATAVSAVGTYPITASGAADPNYNINYTAGNLTIAKVGLIITPDNKNKNYGAALPVLTASYTGFVNGDIAPATLPAIITTATSASPAGTYAITASGAADPNYNITYVAGTLTVDKVPLTITADDKTKFSGDPLPVLTVNYTGLVNGDIATTTLPVVSTTATSSSPLGTYPITATGAADPNYNITYAAGTLYIVNSILTITADNKSKIYGATLPVLTVSYDGLIGGDVAPATPPVISTSGTSSSPTGTYPVTATGAADPRYFFIYVQGTLTVNKAPLTITADNKTKNYGDALPLLTLTYTGLVNGDSETTIPPSLSTPATSSSSAGSYAITAGGASDANYDLTYIDGNMSVVKAVLQVTADNKSKNYGDVNPVLSLSYSGFAGTEDKNVINAEPVLTTTALQYSNTGIYPITSSGGSDENYTFSYNDGVLTINKINLTFTADNKTRDYNTANPDLTYAVTGFVNSETQSVLDIPPSIATTAIQSSTAGTYPVTITGGSDNNYNYLYVAGTLTIAKVSQVITFTDFPEKLLVKDTYTLVNSNTSGLPVLYESLNPDLATIAGDKLTGVSKGNAGIRAYNSGDENYFSAETVNSVEIYSTHKNIMNLFTPNNDGINDLWELPDLSIWGKCNVKVYNRWGKPVFSEKEYNNLWDGTSNGTPVPEGPYYYIIDTENSGIVKGTVNIVR